MTIVLDNASSLPPTERTTPVPARHLPSALGYLPSIALAGAIAIVAFLARNIHGMAVFSPMILAIVIGMAFHNIVGTPSLARPGIAFSLRRLLRAAIVLLGFQLTASQIASVGPRGLFIVALSLTATFAFTVWTGRALGLGRKLTDLIAAGTSICGASAIIATNTVTEAHDEDVAYAIACVTIFGSIAMFAYPLLPRLLHLDPQAYGLWSGASIHEIAQAVAASFQNGQRAGEIGTMAKLARVMLLAPVVFALSMKSRISAVGASGKAVKPPVPWFVIGFIALVGINSLIAIPADARRAIIALTTVLLTISRSSTRKEFARLYWARWPSCSSRPSALYSSNS
jgi:uncharacterized integral membrane protein (TIGR00698 family)